MLRTESSRNFIKTPIRYDSDLVWKDDSHFVGVGKDRIFIDLIGGMRRNFTKIRPKPIIANRLFWYKRLKLPKVRNNISAVYLVGKPRIVFNNQIEMRDAVRTFISESDINMHGHNDKARKFYYNLTVQMTAEAGWRLDTITEVREYVLNFKCRYDVSALTKFNTLINIIRLREEGKLIGYEGSGKLPE